MAFCFEATSTTCGGLWLNAQHRYLGLKFVISGQIHYGWARLNVASCCSATLTGYAYETIPNKRILTGDIVGPLRRAAEKRQGPDPDVDTTIEAQTASRTVPAYQPATLGMLALGSPALSIWWRAASPTF
jgi:hypothetical protein